MAAYPKDPNTVEYTDGWMFGDYLLVSPVLDKGQTSKKIYLPEGTWIDYFKGTVYLGGQTIDYSVDAANWSDVPLFIKQGAIIPSQDFENYVGEKKMTNIYVDAFPDNKETNFEYYDDDGNSTSYKNGNYFKQKFTLAGSEDGKEVQFATALKEGSYNPDVQNYIVRLHIKLNGSVTVSDREVAKYNSLEELKNNFGEGYATGNDVYGEVVCVKIKSGENNTINAQCSFIGK